MMVNYATKTRKRRAFGKRPPTPRKPQSTQNSEQGRGTAIKTQEETWVAWKGTQCRVQARRTALRVMKHPRALRSSVGN